MKRLLLVVAIIALFYSTTHARYYDTRSGRFLQIDPLAKIYPSLSPYAYAANSPLRYIDADGKVIVDAKGNAVNISYNSSGGLTFSKNATQDVIRIANALILSNTGRGRLDAFINSSINVHMNISSDTKTTITPDGRIATWNGQTIQGNMNKDDNYGRVQNKDGTFEIKEASMTIFEGGIKENMKNPNPLSISNGLSLYGLTLEQAIGATAGHESVHAVDKSEIDKDLRYESENPDGSRPDRESKPNQVKRDIINEYKKDD